MGFLLKTTTLLTLIAGVQIVRIATTLATIEFYNSRQPCLCQYEPPDEGGPDSSQGSGTR